MKKLLNSPKTLFASVLILIAACFQLNKSSQPEQVIVLPQTTQQREFERWNLKEGSIYDGDTLRVVRGEEELEIRLFGLIFG